MQWKQRNSHCVSLGDIPQTDACFTVLFSVAVKLYQWHCNHISGFWLGIWKLMTTFCCFAWLLSLSGFPASPQKINSTVFAVMFRMHSIVDIRTIWQRGFGFFFMGQNYLKHFKFSQDHYYFPFLSPIFFFIWRRTKERKKLHLFSFCFFLTKKEQILLRPFWF